MLDAQSSGFVPPIKDRPALTVDVVIFALSNDDLQVLLVQRKDDPYKGVDFRQHLVAAYQKVVKHSL